MNPARYPALGVFSESEGAEMMNAVLAHSFAQKIPDIPWAVVPKVFLGLIAVCAVFKGIYWLVGKMGVE